MALWMVSGSRFLYVSTTQQESPCANQNLFPTIFQLCRYPHHVLSVWTLIRQAKAKASCRETFRHDPSLWYQRKRSHIALKSSYRVTELAVLMNQDLSLSGCSFHKANSIFRPPLFEVTVKGQLLNHFNQFYNSKQDKNSGSCVKLS